MLFKLGLIWEAIKRAAAYIGSCEIGIPDDEPRPRFYPGKRTEWPWPKNLAGDHVHTGGMIEPVLDMRGRLKGKPKPKPAAFGTLKLTGAGDENGPFKPIDPPLNIGRHKVDGISPSFTMRLAPLELTKELQPDGSVKNIDTFPLRVDAIAMKAQGPRERSRYPAIGPRVVVTPPKVAVVRPTEKTEVTGKVEVYFRDEKLHRKVVEDQDAVRRELDAFKREMPPVPIEQIYPPEGDK